MSLITTQAVYTKREADTKRSELEQAHGGHWSIDKIGQKYRVVQDTTREQRNRMEIKQKAEFVLNSDTYGRHFGVGAMRKEMERVKERLDKFVEKFQKDPCYAMSRATDTCQDAADYKVLQEILSYIDGGRDETVVCKYIEEEAERRVEYRQLSCSTSPMSNLMEQAEEIAYRKFAKNLRATVNAKAEALGDLYAVNEGLI